MYSQGPASNHRDRLNPMNSTGRDQQGSTGVGGGIRALILSDILHMRSCHSAEAAGYRTHWEGKEKGGTSCRVGHEVQWRNVQPRGEDIFQAQRHQSTILLILSPDQQPTSCVYGSPDRHSEGFVDPGEAESLSWKLRRSHTAPEVIRHVQNSSASSSSSDPARKALCTPAH